MLRKVKTGGEVFRFSIEGKVTSSMVAELKEAILPVISRSDEIQIDLSTISEIDFAGLLLMVDAKLTAIKRGKALHFIGHSKPVIEILEISGLRGFFDAPIFAGNEPAPGEDRHLMT